MIVCIDAYNIHHSLTVVVETLGLAYVVVEVNQGVTNGLVTLGLKCLGWGFVRTEPKSLRHVTKRWDNGWDVSQYCPPLALIGPRNFEMDGMCWASSSFAFL